jgi:hypothetical protein
MRILWYASLRSNLVYIFAPTRRSKVLLIRGRAWWFLMVMLLRL